MKASGFFFLAAALALAVSSCQGPPGMDGYNGRDGRDGLDGAQVQSVIINVAEDMWEYSYKDDNNYFVAEVDMPEITKDAYIYSLIKTYRICFDDGKYPADPSRVDEQYISANSSLMELPYVRLNEWYNEDVGDWLFYTETVDCEIRVGKLFIYYTAGDFDYELDGHFFTPGPMMFKCSILY